MARSQREEIANYLLNYCFIIGTEESMSDKYYYVINHEAEFQEIFAPIGYTLIVNRSLRVIQVINNYGTGRISLKKYESIILLIIRLLYIEKREKLSTSTEKVIVSVAEIKNEFEKLNLPRKFDQALLSDAMSTLRRYNIAVNIGKLDSSDSKVLVYPSVMLALSDNGISQQYEMVKETLLQYESLTEDEE